MTIFQRLVLKALAHILIGVSEILSQNSNRAGMDDYRRLAGEIDKALIVDEKRR